MISEITIELSKPLCSCLDPSFHTTIGSLIDTKDQIIAVTCLRCGCGTTANLSKVKSSVFWPAKLAKATKAKKEK